MGLGLTGVHSPQTGYKYLKGDQGPQRGQVHGRQAVGDIYVIVVSETAQQPDGLRGKRFQLQHQKNEGSGIDDGAAKGCGVSEGRSVVIGLGQEFPKPLKQGNPLNRFATGLEL
jgi:hypothetical protein